MIHLLKNYLQYSMYVQFILLIPFLVDLATRFRRIGGNYIGMEGDITGIWAQAI
jgi:hypothetical protein